MLDLPEEKTGLAFFAIDYERSYGFDISDILRDELAEIVRKSGLDVDDIDRGEDDERQHDDDDYEDEDSEDDDDIDYPDLEILTDASLWKDVVENFIALNKLTNPKIKLINSFIENYPKKQQRSVTLGPGCFQISGMNEREDIIYCTLIRDHNKLMFSLVSGGKSILLTGTEEFKHYLETLLNTRSKGGYKYFMS